MPNTLTLPLTLAEPSWIARPFTHMRQSRKHGTEAVEQSQEVHDIGFRREAQHQDSLQRRGCLAGLPTCASEAAQPICALAARGFRDAEVGAQKRSAKLVL
jgi:hypothetical protein